MKKLPFRPQAVIFDMDGVIVDSMPYHFIAWYEALRPYGVRVNSFDVYAKEGEKWDRSLRDFLARGGIKATRPLIARIFALRRKIFRKYFKRYIFGDAADLIVCLKKKGYPLALVTGTNEREVQRILPRRLKQCFDVIVTGSDVKRGKPFPDPYRKAARELGITPDRCVVIENAPFGIRSAKGAGMFCIALTTSLPPEYLANADMVVDRIGEINTLIEKTCRI